MWHVHVLTHELCVCCVLYRLAAEQSDVLSDLGLTEPVDKLQVRPSSTPTPRCIPASSWCPSACSRSSAYHVTTPPTPYTLETYLVIMTGHHDVQAFCATLVLPHSPSLISSHSPTYALIHALTPPPHPLTPPPHPPTHSPPPPPPTLARCASSTWMMCVPSVTWTPLTLTAWWPSRAWSHARETSSLTSGGPDSTLAGNSPPLCWGHSLVLFALRQQTILPCSKTRFHA